jgi:hypothetical protein
VRLLLIVCALLLGACRAHAGIIGAPIGDDPVMAESWAVLQHVQSEQRDRQRPCMDALEKIKRYGQRMQLLEWFKSDATDGERAELDAEFGKLRQAASGAASACRTTK